MTSNSTNIFCQYNAKANLSEMSDEQLKEMFPGIAAKSCSNFATKQAISGNYDQITYDNQILSYINEVGYPMKYYPYLFQEQLSEELFAEHNSAEYGIPFDITMVLEIQDKPSWVSTLGMDNDETVTAWIHIRTFSNTIKNILKEESRRSEDYSKIYNAKAREERDHLRKIQPKPRDVFQLTTFGCDREWERGNRMWEITNVEDEIFSEKFNMSMGHYIWKITAKRYRYSFELGMSTLDEKSKDSAFLGEMGEIGNHQVHDSKSCVMMFLSAAGITTETDNETLDELEEMIMSENDVTVKKHEYEKVYDYDIKENSKTVFDMENRVTDFYKDDSIESNGYF